MSRDSSVTSCANVPETVVITLQSLKCVKEHGYFNPLAHDLTIQFHIRTSLVSDAAWRRQQAQRMAKGLGKLLLRL